MAQTKTINKTKVFAFEVTTTYSHYYSIEADSEEQAKKIHNELLKTQNFEYYIDDRAMKCWECERDYEYRGEDEKQFTHIDKEHINDFKADTN